MLELLLLALIGAGASIVMDATSNDDEEGAADGPVEDQNGIVRPPEDLTDDPEDDTQGGNGTQGGGSSGPFPEEPDEPIDEETPPVDPTPVDPAPVDPTPVDPTPVDPTPVDPTPVDPTPVDPTPVDPTPVDPTPVDPTPVDPTPVAPTPVDPTPVDPTPVDPTPVDPTPVDPTPVDPTPVDPTPVDPTPIPPTTSEPAPVDPVIDPTQVPVPTRDGMGQMIVRSGGEWRGNAESNVFVGPTLTVDTPMGPISAPNGPFSDVTLHMGRGDDSITGIGSTSAIYGNGGEDQIIVVGSDLTLSGGEDNDTIILTSSGGSQVMGGLGDDAIQISRGAAVDSGDTVWGGDGDDTIQAAVSLTDSGADGLDLYGGTGADSFGLVIETVDVDATNGGTGEGVTLMDFDPDQDSLTIVLSSDAQLDYLSAEVVNHPSQGYAELVLSFEDDTTGEPYTSFIRFEGVTDLSASDIDLRLQT